MSLTSLEKKKRKKATHKSEPIKIIDKIILFSKTLLNFIKGSLHPSLNEANMTNS